MDHRISLTVFLFYFIFCFKKETSLVFSFLLAVIDAARLRTLSLAGKQTLVHAKLRASHR